MSQVSRGWNSLGTDILRFMLIGLAGVVFVAGVGVLVLMAVTMAGTAVKPMDMAGVVLGVGGMFVLGVVLLGFAAHLRLMGVQIRQQQLLQTTFEQVQQGVLLVEQAVRERPATTAYVQMAEPVPTAGVREVAVGGGVAMDERVLELLQQIRDLTMMDDRQRADMARREFEQRKSAMVRAIERDIDLGQWERAGAGAEELRAMLPEDPTGPQLVARVRDARQLRLTQDVEAARIQLRHLMAITAWAQAEEIVGTLTAKYPNAPEAAVVAEEVRRERDAFERENFQRLMADLKDATDHRQWRRGIMVAEELIRRYPDDPRLARLRDYDVQTLRDNAAAQERREEEGLFKDLLHRQRYEEAAAVARRVIEKYPTSSAAMELAKLLPKVDELVRQERLKRQQTTGPAV